jgi:hypothetical protein
MSTVQRNQLSAAGEALIQQELFEANRLPLVLAVGGSSGKKALKCTIFCGITQSKLILKVIYCHSKIIFRFTL